MKFNDRELATVLAALRCWQRYGDSTDDDISDVATCDETLLPLSNTEINELCERLLLQRRMT